MTSIDSVAKKQLDSIIRKTVDKKNWKKSEFQCLYNLSDLTLEQVVYTDIIAYSEPNQYIRIVIYTDLFNRYLNRGCLVYMFSLSFSGSKFLLNLRRQFRVGKIFFVYTKFSVHRFLRDLQSSHFAFKITFSKMRNLCSRLLFH